MNKAKSILIIILFTAVAYGVVTLFMPVVTEVITDTDATLAAHSTNVTALYPGAIEVMDWTPWVLYLSIGVIAVVSAVIVLRRQESP